MLDFLPLSTLELFAEFMRERGQTLALAESCAGGLAAKLITDAAGASAYFLGSVVSYQNAVKEHLLHCGELVLITCYEWSRAQPDAMLLATNGFVLEAGEYRMTIHQAGPVRALMLSGDADGGERMH